MSKKFDYNIPAEKTANKIIRIARIDFGDAAYKGSQHKVLAYLWAKQEGSTAEFNFGKSDEHLQYFKKVAKILKTKLPVNHVIR